MQRCTLGLMLGGLFGMGVWAAEVPTDEELFRAAERHVEELVKQKRAAKAEAERQAEAAKQAEAARAAELERLLATLERDLLRVKGGTFQMGSPADEKDRDSDERQHEVKVKDFFIGKYEVTQQQWRAVMGSNPSSNKDCDACPVEEVSWNDIQDFLTKLNAKTGKAYRLPNEAEWEYACRSGGKAELYCGGADLDRLAWYDKNSGGKTQPVGKKAPNGLGIYDMSGNVWEWTCSAYDQAYQGGKTRCANPGEGGVRVLRGGSWGELQRNHRAAIRNRLIPDGRFNINGFRLARTL